MRFSNNILVCEITQVKMSLFLYLEINEVFFEYTNNAIKIVDEQKGRKLVLPWVIPVSGCFCFIRTK